MLWSVVFWPRVLVAVLSTRSTGIGVCGRILPVVQAPQKFGGPWSLIKVDTVAKYYSAFNTALKNRGFKKICIDAFAGSGDFQFNPRDASPLFDEAEVVETHAGSARRALATDPPFDKLIFVESGARNIAALTKTALQFPKADVDILRGDANVEVKRVCKSINWQTTRGVLFLDPFGHSVDWSTISEIGKTKLDVWYLFPLSGVYRNVPVDRSDLTPDKRDAVTRILGTSGNKRTADVDAIEAFVKQRLESVFPLVLAPKRLLGPTNAPLYSLFFAMSNKSPQAQAVAMPIARHLLSNI